MECRYWFIAKGMNIGLAKNRVWDNLTIDLFINDSLVFKYHIPFYPCLVEFPLSFSKLLPILWNPTEIFSPLQRLSGLPSRQLFPHLVSQSYTSFFSLNTNYLLMCLFPSLKNSWGQRTVSYSYWWPRCLVHCSVCVVVGNKSLLHEWFLCFACYYAPGTLRKALDTTSYWVSQQFYK